MHNIGFIFNFNDYKLFCELLKLNPSKYDNLKYFKNVCYLTYKEMANNK